MGDIPETEKMLNFCAQRCIVSDVEMIKDGDINDAYERMLQAI